MLLLKSWIRPHDPHNLGLQACHGHGTAKVDEWVVLQYLLCRNYLRSDRYVFRNSLFSSISAQKQQRSSNVSYKYSILKGPRQKRRRLIWKGEKKNSPAHLHIQVDHGSPSRECRTPKVWWSHRLRGRGIFGSQSLVNAPLLSLINRAHVAVDATHLQWSSWLCCLHHSVHYPPHCCELFPSQ